MLRDFLILQSTNFEEGNNAQVLCVVRNVANDDELIPICKDHFETLKKCVMDEMNEGDYSEDIVGKHFYLTQNGGDYPLIYEIYPQPMPMNYIKITDIVWEKNNDENIDLPTECFLGVPSYADEEFIKEELCHKYKYMAIFFNY